MTEQEIIEALKKNDKPFGLMSGDMQAKAREIGQHDIEVFVNEGWEALAVIDGYEYEPYVTYRLRSDYQEESFIKCEVKVNRHSILIFDWQGSEKGILLCEASAYPDFIGFLYQDGLVCASPVMYSVKGQTNRGYYAPLDGLESGQAHAYHPTHVLFRRSK